jgi:hypothetical protein
MQDLQELTSAWRAIAHQTGLVTCGPHFQSAAKKWPHGALGMGVPRVLTEGGWGWEVRGICSSLVSLGLTGLQASAFYVSLQ